MIVLRENDYRCESRNYIISTGICPSLCASAVRRKGTSVAANNGEEEWGGDRVGGVPGENQIFIQPVRTKF